MVTYEIMHFDEASAFRQGLELGESPNRDKAALMHRQTHSLDNLFRPRLLLKIVLVILFVAGHVEAWHGGF